MRSDQIQQDQVKTGRDFQVNYDQTTKDQDRDNSNEIRPDRTRSSQDRQRLSSEVHNQDQKTY